MGGLTLPQANNPAADLAANVAMDSRCSSISLRPPLAWAVPKRSPGMVRCAGFDDPKLIPPAVTYPPYLPSVLAGVSRLSAADVCFRGVSTTFGP
jgi:hypothetical protein